MGLLFFALGVEYGSSHPHGISPFHNLTGLVESSGPNSNHSIFSYHYIRDHPSNNYPKNKTNSIFSHSPPISLKMASLVAGVVVCAILVFCMVVPSLATAYTVGDTTGWTTGVDYSTWTSGKTFAVDDSLGESSFLIYYYSIKQILILRYVCINTYFCLYIIVFKYGGGHTVDEVSASDYNTCSVSTAINSDNSGATTVSLKTAGTHYFICGVIGHCANGMKLAVTVAAAGSTTTPSSPGTTPSSGATTNSPTTSGSNTTIYNPSSNNMPESSSGTFSPFVAIVATWVAFFVMVLS